MEANFRSYLRLSEVSEAAIAVLEEELVLNSVVFSCLREEHFERLLPKLRVGDHAALLRIWDKSSVQEAEVHVSWCFFYSYSHRWTCYME